MSFLGIGLPAFTELAGGLIGGALNSAYQRSRMREQAAIMKDLWSFQQQNAHQYEVQDLRNAGLNPILSATNSQIASMPSVSTPTSAPFSGLGNGLGNTLNTAMKISIDKDLKLKDQQIERDRLENEIKRTKLLEEKQHAEIKKIESDITIAFEDLDIRKELKDADIEKTHAVIEDLNSHIGVNVAMAAKLGMEVNELKRKIKYGAFLATYLPDEPAEWIYSKLGSFIKNNPTFDEFCDKYSSAMGLAEKQKLALETYEEIKKNYSSSD